MTEERLYSVALSTGLYLPDRVVSNKELSSFVDTSDEWIFERTGIRQRHIAADTEYTSDLAMCAGQNALRAANLSADDIDAIIVATTTPDKTFPSTATIVQHKLGMQSGFAFDIQAVCSGFIYALSVADGLLRTEQARRILVIGAETFTRLLDWEDRTTCVLFGDGAGAIILESQKADSARPSGILTTCLHSDGQYADKLCVSGGVSTTKTIGSIQMHGREVFRHAVDNLAAVSIEALEKLNITKDEIDWIIPHQANKRIIDSTAKRIGAPSEKIVVTVQDHANTSAASIPLALATAVNDGRIQKGHTLLLEAMGGGFTWGSTVIRW
jgi:3-oxoacyl-[acyl-carrier-protein] synthase III